MADNVDIEGDIDVNGTSNLDNTDIDGTLVVDGSNISLDSTATLNIDNSNTSNGITIGTATSGVPISIGHTTSETTVNDNLVVTGDIDLDGSIDVNGTANLDAVDIDGNVQLDGTLTVGTDGSGQDVIFYSATAGDSFAWDASEEKLTITGTDGAVALDVADGIVKIQESLSITNPSGSFYVWSDDPFGSNYEVIRIDKPSGSNGRISVYKGGTGAYRGLSLETGSAGEGIIIDSSSNVAIANNLDVDGTTNLDAVDIDGDVDISGSITNATWTGDVIASAYLDADTAHLSGSQTFSGAKTFSEVVDITNTTDASDDSGDTGALRVEGGASIAKKLYVGGATTVGENDATASSLGIGTDASITANTTKLQIGNHNTAVSAIYLTDNDAQDDWYIASNQTLAMGYNNSAKLSITQAGDVGINTNAPETKFTIDQTADDNGIRIYGYDDVSSRYGEIFIDSSGYLNIDASTDRGIEIKGHANDFWVNSGADLFVRMTYDSKLGVGTTSPSEVLTVSGNIDLKNSSGFAKIDNSGSLSMSDDATVTISSSRNGSALILVYEVGSGIGALFFTCFGLAVTKLAGTSLTANSDSDGDLCCFNSGHTITIKNRLGATKTVVITVLGGNVY